MKILCKYNDPDHVMEGVPNSFNFGLVKGKEYLVMGMVLAQKQIWYLIDEKSKPNFYPFQLFEISDALIHSDWYFKVLSKDDGIAPFDKEMIMGYSELVFKEDHYEKLVDRNRTALEYYFKRKLEFENLM